MNRLPFGLVLFDRVKDFAGSGDVLIISAVLVSKFRGRQVVVGLADQFARRHPDQIAVRSIDERDSPVQVLSGDVDRQVLDQRMVERLRSQDGLRGLVLAGHVAHKGIEDQRSTDPLGDQHREFGRELRSVAAESHHLDPPIQNRAVARLEKPPHPGRMRLSRFRRDDRFRHRETNRFVARPPEHAFRLLIPRDDLACRVNRDECVAGGSNDRLRLLTPLLGQCDPVIDLLEERGYRTAFETRFPARDAGPLQVLHQAAEFVKRRLAGRHERARRNQRIGSRSRLDWSRAPS